MTGSSVLMSCSRSEGNVNHNIEGCQEQLLSVRSNSCQSGATLVSQEQLLSVRCIFVIHEQLLSVRSNSCQSGANLVSQVDLLPVTSSSCQSGATIVSQEQVLSVLTYIPIDLMYLTLTVYCLVHKGFLIIWQ